MRIMERALQRWERDRLILGTSSVFVRITRAICAAGSPRMHQEMDILMSLTTPAGAGVVRPSLAQFQDLTLSSTLTLEVSVPCKHSMLEHEALMRKRCGQTERPLEVFCQREKDGHLCRNQKGDCDPCRCHCGVTFAGQQLPHAFDTPERFDLDRQAR